MKPSLIAIFIFFVVIVFFELYFIQALKTVSIDYAPNKRKYILWFAYTLAGCSLLLFITAAFYPPPEWNNTMRFIATIS